MKQLLVLFALVAIIITCGTSCTFRTQGTGRFYYGKTARHYGAPKRQKIRNSYWGKHRGGYRGHDHRGWYR